VNQRDALGTALRIRGAVGALVAGCIAFGSVLFVGCSAESRYRVLTTVFDGVPTPRPTAGPGEPSAASTAGAPSRRVGFTEHGPYAAKLCNACHSPAAANELLAPRDQLCSRCHELTAGKRYVHGPLASGGCLVCHDPHSSRFRYLLVSDSDTFCLDCHDRQSIAKIGAHQGVAQQCTACHDAHMSDKEYLLR
jgi:predicted CXXCH cytochrome family protein